jgi:hypothetical protein
MPDDNGGDDDGLVHVNGIDPVTGQYLVQPSPVATFATRLASPPADAEMDAAARRRIRDIQDGLQKVIADVDENDLGNAGWGVVFSGCPEHTAFVAEARDQLELLLNRRKEASGPRYREYADADGLQDESAVEWLNRHGVGPGPADPEQMPFYLLIVGGPDQVPFEFQYRVDIQRAVGRICFDDPADYRRYAEAVVAHEEHGPTATKRLELFGPRNRGDKATSVSLRRLVEPLQNRLGKKFGWQVSSTTDAAATREALSHLVNEDNPALLLSAGHGLGLAADDPEQRTRQGALVCADWPGIGNPVQPAATFGAADVADDADLSGRMAFLFACFGGGTPATDDFAHRVDPTAPKQLTAAVFASALPQKLLSRGMLAVMAHVDRAWGYSFGTASADSTQTFQSALTRLMNNNSVGVAFDDFNVRAGELAYDLADLLARVVDKDISSYLPYGSMWTSATDARNYVVFGDPAVRLST